MSTHEPLADRVGSPAPPGADSPPWSAVVSGEAQPSAGVESNSEAATLSEACAKVETPAKGEECADGDMRADGDAQPDNGSGRWFSRTFLLCLGACLLVLLLVNTFVVRPFAVPSESMEGTLRPGDRLLVNQLAYDFGSHVRRGDVVVFDGIGSFLPYASEPSAGQRFLAGLGLSSGGDSVYVKRVIGIGGDRVTCCGSDGRIRVNGVPLDESGYLYPGDTPSKVAFDVVVPAGKLWVMGDHRGDSRDSRDHLGEPGGGFVPESKVIGRADWVIFPIGRWTSLDRPAGFAAAEGTGGHGGQR
ncbi:signal peptidase I [Kitasatospora sp. GP82]|nr:signal peptidase I [Kitasatospora sp. GP82]